jgi:PAS domain S-box-containing protein
LGRLVQRGLRQRNTINSLRKDGNNPAVGSSTDSSRKLRQRAQEKILKGAVGVQHAPTPGESLALFEELHIHQVELELQNEQLRCAQAALEASRTSYFDLYNLAPVGYLTVSEQGAILQANLRAASLLGSASSALLSRHFSRLIVAPTCDTYYLALKRLLESGEPQTCEVKMLRTDASHFWARLEMSLAKDESGRVLRIVILDITVRIELEEALRQTNGQLALEKRIAEEATAAKTLFLSAMSHEIRTPLNGVIGMASLLMQTHLSAEQLDYARLLSQSAESLLSLANDILDLSKIEAGKFELEETPFNLPCLIEDSLDLISFTAKEKSLELACWYPAGVPTHFLGDAGRIRQILTNFLSNAAKFTSSGYILVEVEAAEPIDGKSAVRISVHDTGMGISRNMLDHLFTHFHQADATIARRFGGTGLGLAIVKEIVELMGGQVSVASREGEGSTFSCRIPLKVDQCDLGRLPSRLKSAASECRQFDIVVVHGDSVDQCKAVSGFRSSVSGLAPKLFLFTSGTIEESSYLAADLSFSTPVRASAFSEQLRQLPPPSGVPLRPEARPPPLQSLAPSERANVKVLVADDNLVNQKLACALLSHLGCQVETANNGAEAFEKVSRNDYRIVFMDCAMPVMDGFAATIAIRGLAGAKSRLPIVAVTAFATAEDSSHCFAVGMNDFLTKPLRSDMLSACLAKWLNHD